MPTRVFTSERLSASGAPRPRADPGRVPSADHGAHSLPPGYPGLRTIPAEEGGHASITKSQGGAGRLERAYVRHEYAVIYIVAGTSYTLISMHAKVLLNWIVGPLWPVAFMWWRTDRRAPRDGLEGAAAMSWAAHQFEYYALRVTCHSAGWARSASSPSWSAIRRATSSARSGRTASRSAARTTDPKSRRSGTAAGRGSADALAAVGLRRCWITYLLTRNRAWTLGVGLGAAAHALTDISDSVGTMLAFPFNTQTFSYRCVGVCGDDRRRQVPRRCGVLQQLGLRDGRLWFVIALTGWRCLTHAYWKRTRGGRPSGVGMARPAPAGASPGDAVPVVVHLRAVPAHRLDVVGPRHRGLRVGLHVGWAELDPPGPAVPSRARGGGGCLGCCWWSCTSPYGAAPAPWPGAERLRRRASAAQSRRPSL